MTRRLVVAFAMVAALTGVVPAASAQTSGDGSIDPAYVRASAADLGVGTFPGPAEVASAPGVESPYTWTRTATGGRCVVFPGPVPDSIAPSVTSLLALSRFIYVTGEIGKVQDAPEGAS